MPKSKPYFNKVIVFVHDGVFCATSGAGNSNARFLHTILEERPTTKTIICPVRVRINGSNFNKNYYNNFLRSISKYDCIIDPVDNGTLGVHMFGTIKNWKILTKNSLKIVDKHLSKSDKALIISFDTSFAGIINGLGKYTNATHVHIPRSTGLIHDASDKKRISFEKDSFTRINKYTNSYLGATSTYMFQHLTNNYGIKKDKILNVTNGVLLDTHQKITKKTIDNAEKTIGIPKNTKYIFSYGRGMKYKGFHILLDALHKMDPKVRPFFVVIATEYRHGSDYIKYLKGLIKTYNLKGVLLTNYEYELPNIIQQSHNLLAIVVPSLKEPFGLLPIENFANKFGSAPIIASDTGGLPEQVVENKTGFLFKCGNPLDLSKIISDVTLLSTKEKKRIKAGGLALVKKHYNYAQNIKLFLSNVENIARKEVNVKRIL